MAAYFAWPAGYWPMQLASQVASEQLVLTQAAIAEHATSHAQALNALAHVERAQSQQGSGASQNGDVPGQPESRAPPDPPLPSVASRLDFELQLTAQSNAKAMAHPRAHLPRKSIERQ